MDTQECLGGNST